MEDWRRKRDWLLDAKNHQVMIASHRGKFSSSVMENTSLAFLLAVEQGADMVEMDLERTKDGILVGHHDKNMMRLFHTSEKISDYTLEELRKLPLYNYVGEICEEQIETFEEILKGLKEKALLVLDKCWDDWEQVYRMLEQEGMTEQAIFKFYIENQDAYQWAKGHPDCMFVPMLKNVEDLPEIAELKKFVCVPALEILPEKETDPVFQAETFRWLEEQQIKVWCNSLSLAKRLVYGAGYDDLKSLRHGGDFGWGKLIDQGVTIIQTDWPYELKQYLDSREKDIF